MNARTILITGATTGIGRTAALHLARRGHRVFATGRNEAALAELLQEATDTSLETLRLDVTSTESIAAAKAFVDRRTNGRGVDVLVNNAGYGIAGGFDGSRESEQLP
jgi:short-subunit dehydrogenase